MLLWWWFDVSLKKHCWNSKDFDANIIVHKVLFVLVSELLSFRWFFIVCSVMILGRNFDETASVSVQTVLCILAFIVLVFETFLFPWSLIDYSLMIFWGGIDETLMILIQSWRSVNFVKCKPSKHWCFIAVWLFFRWWLFEEFSMTHWWRWCKL